LRKSQGGAHAAPGTSCNGGAISGLIYLAVVAECG
jgi:hypothetical protein